MNRSRYVKRLWSSNTKGMSLRAWAAKSADPIVKAWLVAKNSQ